MVLFEKNPYGDSRFSRQGLEETIAACGHKDFVVLADRFTAPLCEGYPTIVADAPDFNVESLKGLAYVIYAMDGDDLGAEMVGHLERFGVPFYAARLTPLGRTAKYFHVVTDARECLRLEHDQDEAEGVHHFNEEDFANIAQVIDLTRDIEGAYVEVGTFNGASARYALRYMTMRGVTRDCYFLDVFSGFDYDAAQTSVDQRWAGTHASHGIDVVSARLKAFASEKLKVEVRRNNIISDPFPEDIGPIAVANLDVDMLDAVRSGLEVLAPKIVKGGMLIVEDPGHTPTLIGARMALNEFLAKDDQFLPIYMESGQTLLIRK